MSTNTIEEPTVVTDDYSTSGKIFKTFFKSTKGIYIYVIGRFVQQEYVTLFFQCHSKMQAIAFTTGKYATKFLLITTREIKAWQVSTRINIASTHTNQFRTTGDYLINTFIRIDVTVLLVYISHLYGLSYFKLTFIYSFQSHNQTEQRSFTGTVRTDNTNDTIGGKHEVEIIEQ